MERIEDATETVELGVASEETRGSVGLYQEFIGKQATPPMLGTAD